MTPRNALHGFSTRVTSQSRPIPMSSQVENSAGGFAWEIDKWKRLERFLILGTEGGTYYIGQRKLTEENAQALLECIAEDGMRTLDMVHEISVKAKAPKNDQALFALAAIMSHADVNTRRAAGNLLPEISRIGTHLFQFIEYKKQFGGRGPIFKRAVQEWYQREDMDKVAYQVVKYRQRNGWTHRDVLRLVKPVPEDPDQQGLFAWITGKNNGVGDGELLLIIEGFEKAQKSATYNETAARIRQYGLTWEMVKSEHLNSSIVMEALLEKMPMMATIRQLPKLTSIGLLKPFDQNVDLVVERLKDIKGSKVHPFQVLVALNTYKKGIGRNFNWSPVPQIVDALDDAFYTSFENVEPSNKTHVLGLDVSGSMDWTYDQRLNDMAVTPRDIAACTAMVTVRAEPKTVVLAFAHQLLQVAITPKMRLDTVISELKRLPFGGTDCSLPIIEAARQEFNVDVFAIYTDNETWAGSIHPAQAIKQYREKFVSDAKMVVVACASNGFSIADPNDPGMLDVVGFDTGVPALIADFVRG